MAVETVTIGTAVGRDYSDFRVWEATEGKNLQVAGVYHELECYDDAVMDSGVVINSFATNPAYYVDIHAMETEWHDASLGSGFTIDYTGALSNIFTVQEAHIRIRGLQFNSGSATGACQAINVYGVGAIADPDIRIDSCIIYGEGSADGLGIKLDDSAITVTVVNNIVYVDTGYGINIASVVAAYVYNNTVFDGATGIRQYSGTVYAKNNVCVGQSTAAFAGTFHADSDYNVGGDTTAPGSNSQDSKTAANCFVSVASGSEDFNIKDADSPLYQAGTNLSADGNFAFTADGVLFARPSAWSVGALEWSLSDSMTVARLQNRLYSIFAFGIFEISLEAEMQDLMAEFGDLMTVNVGSPTRTLTKIPITRVGYTLVSRSRVHLTGVFGQWLENENGAWASE